MRRCKWCQRLYDPDKGSSIFCDDNPHRGRGAKRWYARKRKPSIVVIGALSLEPSPFWPEPADAGNDLGNERRKANSRL